MARHLTRAFLLAFCLSPAMASAAVGVTPTQVYNLYMANPGNAAYRLTLTGNVTGTDTSNVSRTCNVMWFDSSEPLATQRYSFMLAAFLTQKAMGFSVDPMTTLPGWCHVIEVWVSP